MARPSLTAIAVVFAALAAPLVPAGAQFGTIFSDSPPRPPADVPNRPPSPPANLPPASFPPAASPQILNLPPGNVPRPPADLRSDVPPAEPLPAPMNLPPAARPGASAIQSQPLAPPPGTAAPTQANVPPQPGTQPNAPVQTLPGLPPGVRQPRAAPQQADTPQPGDEVVVEPPPQRIANPTAVFSGLDKITGRITSFDVAINETVQFGALQVTPRVCYSRPPTENPNTDAFVEVDEVTLSGEIKRIFTGWMFAASPGLHAIEHPIYDVWLTDCKGGSNPAVAEAPSEQPVAPKPQAKPAPKRAPPRTQGQRGFLPALR
jgi:hypothetical protein